MNFGPDETWSNLYGERWGDEITPAAYVHPAKYSRGLVRYIYRHAIDAGWFRTGSRILDPFAGVALGALNAMSNRLDWLGIELVDEYHTAGLGNLELWNSKYSARFPGWGSADLVHGDSSELIGQLGPFDGLVSSPPYADGCVHTGGDTSKSRDFVDGGAVHLPGLVNMENVDLYNSTAADGQLADMAADGFWSVVSVILGAIYKRMNPGSRSYWVVKSYVRDKRRVDFPGAWQRACERAGFRLGAVYHASFIVDRGSQFSLFDGLVRNRVEHKSYWRRVNEKGGSPSIDYEVILCMVK